MSEQYEPSVLEPDVQEHWNRTGAFEVREDSAKEPFYCLSMFPYPSGKCHMGHVRNYTIGDVISRYQRMCGRNVLQPMGWDAFGLPAENAAIKNRVPPAEWTYGNIDNMRRQLKRLGYAYDWTREVTTCRPEYYRWEQQMFVRLFERGLVYRQDSEVNWDPVDQTVLANEQVVDGRGWRSGAVVERRKIPQWFIKITAYADELLDGLDKLPDWPDAVKTMQRNWIGRSRGLEIQFDVPEHDPITVFTTRPDTLQGATYMAVAPEHPLAQKAAQGSESLAAFVRDCQHGQTAEAALETMEKKGMPLGIDAVHPLHGGTVPVWVANFVLMSYGTGAIMAVPGHDQRDWEFAQKYDLPIRQVIEPASGEAVDVGVAPNTEYGKVINSGELDGLDYEGAFAAVSDMLGAREQVNFRLRDWGVSRQRYWGCPIPIIYCDKCGAVPVPEDQLPVVLPEDIAFSGVSSPLKDMAEFVNCTCPACGGEARRETDTFDTFVESSWYYARYTSPNQDSSMVDQRADYWLPVHQYIGGIEHAVMHLLYFRFWHKLMRDFGWVGSDEPAARLLCQGMVVAETFYRGNETEGITYFAPDELELKRDEQGRIVGATALADGEPVTLGRIEKMSKSKNNGVDPESMIERFGADTVRLFSMFASPPDQSLEWSEAGVEGMYRFLRSLWRQVNAHVAQGPVEAVDVEQLDDSQRRLRRQIHESIDRVTDDVGRRLKFNKAIAVVMELINATTRHSGESKADRAVRQESWETVVLLLAPIVPHITHRLWSLLGHDSNLLDEMWPQVDQQALVKNNVVIVVQVNGKLRGRLEAPAGADKASLEALALEQENVAKFIEGKQVRKVIVVPDKLVNIVAT